jgi:hypothetical protein
MDFARFLTQAGHVEIEALDDVVQHLAVAKYALEAHDREAALAAVDAGLSTARRLMSDTDTTDFVRSRPAAC